eukprot:UC1_evm1s1054
MKGAVPSAAACEREACARNVQAWSYCAPGLHCQLERGQTNQTLGPFCLVGSAGRFGRMWMCTGNCSWTTRVRPDMALVPGENFSMAQPGYNDSDWSLVDIPHDAARDQPYTSVASGPEGFQPA